MHAQPAPRLAPLRPAGRPDPEVDAAGPAGPDRGADLGADPGEAGGCGGAGRHRRRPAEGAAGGLWPVHEILVGPEELPAVRQGDLDLAWHAARDAALADAWGAIRGFRFRRADGRETDLVLADRDACCWVGAVDRLAGLGSRYGLSLCLRLLALIDLLARAPWTAPLCRLARDGAEFDPRLLRLAATAPLSAEARFDEAAFRLALGGPAAPSRRIGVAR
jgi:hypothetical protein